MMVFWLIIFLIALILMIHSYVIYPSMMRKLAGREQNWNDTAYRPSVAILLSAYNEEDVLEEKIRTSLNTDYPKDKLSLWIGSDASTDRTAEIVESFAVQDPRIHFFPFDERTGKPEIINRMQQQCDADILILTDADTMFEPDTIPELMKPFQDDEVGGVQANILPSGDLDERVAHQELHYTRQEFLIKKGQSIKGAIIGAFGACYALRNNLYHPVPGGFKVDDFFIFMHILADGYKTVMAEKARCHMLLSGRSDVQFRRKKRISSGNFQNLIYFAGMINPFRGFASYAFFSQKVIRWFGPFLMLLMLVSSYFLMHHHVVFEWLFYGQVAFYLLAIADFFLLKMHINLRPVRTINHFVLMNLALLLGFLHFISGERNTTWDNKE